MLETTISEILKAEEDADAMVKQATDDGKQMVANANAEGEKIRLETLSAVKLERKNVVDKATQDAEKQYEEIINSGKKHSQALKDEVDISKAVKFIQEKVFSRYGNS